MKIDFGKKVRYYRLKAKKTQKELADYLGYKTSSSVAKIEDGTNDVLLSTAERIAVFLGIGMISFFEDIPDNENQDYKEYNRFIPYLAKAKGYQLKAIEDMLGMPSSEEGR